MDRGPGKVSNLGASFAETSICKLDLDPSPGTRRTLPPGLQQARICDVQGWEMASCVLLLVDVHLVDTVPICGKDPNSFQLGQIVPQSRTLKPKPQKRKT